MVAILIVGAVLTIAAFFFLVPAPEDTRNDNRPAHRKIPRSHWDGLN